MLSDSTPDMPVKPRRGRYVGPYSRPGALAGMDRRTRAGRLLKAITADLVAHVGGNPTVTQRWLITRVGMLALRCGQLDAKIIEGGGLTEHDSRTFLAWSNSLSRALRDLGLDAAAAAPQSLASILAAPPNPRPAAAVAAPERAQADPGTDDALDDAEPLAGILEDTP